MHSVAALVQGIVASIDREGASEMADLGEKDLDTVLSRFRRLAHQLCDSGRYLVIALDAFDAILKFSEPEQIRHVLNAFQALGGSSVNRTAVLVRCYRNIEDICQSSNYSDFYKIFGAICLGWAAFHMRDY